MSPTTLPITSSFSSLQPGAGHRLGLEMEMAVARSDTGRSYPAQRYLSDLHAIKQTAGMVCDQALAPGAISFSSDTAQCGFDNGWNLLETALRPVTGRPGAFQMLAQRAHLELAHTLAALEPHKATVLNASQHPDCSPDAGWYGQTVVPRPIYFELRGYRGWHHWHGSDAKAQNGANTSMPVGRIVRGLNVLLALSAASIALFANSPLEGGQRTGFKEHRMTLWPRVFGPARFRGDLKLATYPARPFRDLADFFNWMFGPGTVTRALPQSPGSDYKAANVVMPQGDPCLQQFLKAPAWPARHLDTRREVLLKPSADHFVYSQIGQFLDARIRYRLDHMPELDELMVAWNTDGGLEALFERCAADMYLEARSPGANFADMALLDDAGPAVARSVLMAPLALQTGLLSNLDQAWSLVNDWGWETLGALRRDAMRHAMEHECVRRLCVQVLQVAAQGLSPDERPWLDYAAYVTGSGRCGADRMLSTWNSTPGDASQRLIQVVRRHGALHPGEYGALGTQVVPLAV